MTVASARVSALSLLVVAVVISTMGPYIGPGLRVEQALIYLAATALIPILLKRRFETGTGMATFAWLVIVAVTVTITFVSPDRSIAEGAAGLDAVLMPLAVMLIATVAGSDDRRAGHLLVVQKTTVVCMSINSLLAISMIAFPGISSVVERLYWSAGAGVEESIAARVYGIGRIVGVFHSPFAAGGAYSLALLVLVGLVCQKRIGTWVSVIFLTLIIVGGFLTQSKLFILIGLPLATGMYMVSRTVGTKGIFALFGSVGAIAFLIAQADEWTQDALGRFSLLLENSDSFTDLVTAGRLTSDSAVGSVSAMALEKSPLYGLGPYAAELGPLDTSWTELVARAGIVGVACLALIFLVFGYRIASSFQHAAWNDFVLACALLILWFAATFGGPTVTANRFGALLVLNLWLLVPVLTSVSRVGALRGAVHVTEALTRRA